MSQVDRKRLNEAYEALRVTRIPPSGDSDRLDEWRAELIEFDGFYVGIASTVLNHGSVNHDLVELDTLEKALRNIQPETDQDREGLAAAHAYMQRLVEVREALRAIVRTGG